VAVVVVATAAATARDLRAGRRYARRLLLVLIVMTHDLAPYPMGVYIVIDFYTP
jgi:hypothetical protein